MSLARLSYRLEYARSLGNLIADCLSLFVPWMSSSHFRSILNRPEFTGLASISTRIDKWNNTHHRSEIYPRSARLSIRPNKKKVGKKSKLVFMQLGGENSTKDRSRPLTLHTMLSKATPCKTTCTATHLHSAFVLMSAWVVFRVLSFFPFLFLLSLENLYQICEN